MKEFKKLHVGEWRESYNDNDYGVQIMDGTSWGLNVQFSNELGIIEYGGSNAYPYNIWTVNKLVMKAFDERFD